MIDCCAGFPNTRCSHAQTGLYNFYIMFNTVYVMLCLLFTIALISNVLDLIWYNAPQKEDGRYLFWNTRRHEVFLKKRHVTKEERAGSIRSAGSVSDGGQSHASFGGFSAPTPNSQMAYPQSNPSSFGEYNSSNHGYSILDQSRS